MKTMDKKEMT